MSVHPLSVADEIQSQGRVELGGAIEPEWTLSAVGGISLVAGVRERMEINPEGMFPGMADALRADMVYGPDQLDCLVVPGVS